MRDRLTTHHFTRSITHSPIHEFTNWIEAVMEVILRDHVDNLGRRGEIVKVADGYARNYLLPRKLALLATEGNKKQVERERAKFEAKELEEKNVAEAVADRLKNVEV